MQVISRMILALKYKKKMSRRSNYSSTSLFKAWVTWVRVKIRMIVILSGSENWILNLRFLSRSDVGPEIMKQQHVSSEEGGAEEYKLQGNTQGPEAALQICLPSPTDRLFSCSRKCQSCLETKCSWPLGTSSYWAVLVAPFNWGKQKLLTTLLG